MTRREGAAGCHRDLVNCARNLMALAVLALCRCDTNVHSTTLVDKSGLDIVATTHIYSDLIEVELRAVNGTDSTVVFGLGMIDNTLLHHPCAPRWVEPDGYLHIFLGSTFKVSAHSPTLPTDAYCRTVRHRLLERNRTAVQRFLFALPLKEYRFSHWTPGPPRQRIPLKGILIESYSFAEETTPYWDDDARIRVLETFENGTVMLNEAFLPAGEITKLVLPQPGLVWDPQQEAIISVTEP